MELKEEIRRDWVSKQEKLKSKLNLTKLIWSRKDAL